MGVRVPPPAPSMRRRRSRVRCQCRPGRMRLPVWRARQRSCRLPKRRATGLKRELKVIIAQGELSQRFTTRLDEVKDTVQLKGFRKGKVPVAHIKKLYGRSLMAEVLQQAVEETSRKAIKERNERAGAPAQHQPDRGQGRDRARAVGPERSRLHDVLRGAARDQDHRPRRPQARARGGRRVPRGRRQGRRRSARALRSATRWRPTAPPATATA